MQQKMINQLSLYPAGLLFRKENWQNFGKLYQMKNRLERPHGLNEDVPIDLSTHVIQKYIGNGNEFRQNQQSSRTLPVLEL